MWPHHLTHLWLIQPADEAKQAAFASAVVTDQTNTCFAQLQGEMLKDHGVTALQGDVFKRNVCGA
jgi:hypothetical protein